MAHRHTTRTAVLLVGISLVLMWGVGFARADDTAATSTPATTEATTTPTLVDSGESTSTPQDTEPSSQDTQNATPTLSFAPQATSTATTTPPQTQAATSTSGTGGTSNAQGGDIETGDAVATSTVDNELNINTTNPDSPGETNSSSIIASSTNSGELESEASSTASTGNNSVEGGDGANTVATGDAVATANVINVVNTNLFNSDGLVLFLNQLFGGGLDLNQYDLSYFFNGGPGASAAPNAGTTTQPCTILTCLNSSDLQVLNSNTATVTNSVLVRASTGSNTASSTSDASIQSGNAYAAANVLNLVNTNLINSSYLLVSFNNFGDLLQNITLPGADFFQKLFSGGGALPQLNSSTYTATNTNTATTTDSTTADAMTGGNVASSTASSTGQVASGNAYTSASTFNQENTNLLGGASVFMLFRVWGDWTGTVQGLPPGISWKQTQDGIELVSDESSSTPQGDGCQYENHTLVGGPCFNSSSFLASSTNTAALSNDVHVYALTGDNKASSQEGTSSVSSGDAYAAANVINMVNTNVVGRNWIFAIFNIFGNWSGNIAFGEPDLWIGAVAQTQNPTPPGSDVTYVFTVANHGNADATHVKLSADFDKNALTFSSDASSTDSGDAWDLGTIPRGESRDFTFTARAADIPQGTSLTVPLTATVSGTESDGNEADNTEEVTIVVSSPATGGGGGGGGGILNFSAWTPDPDISVTKTASIGTTTASSTVDYTVVVKNSKSAGALYQGLLSDTLTDPSGAVMYSNTWDLDTVEPGDEITLSYSVEYASSTLPGTYRNTASVTGLRNAPSSITGGAAISPVEAQNDIMLLPEGLTLGTSTQAQASSTDDYVCSPLLMNMLRAGAANEFSDVLKLQHFLNVQGVKVPQTGFFGPLTTAAVKTFQRTYADEILAPAGASKPTGFVYAFTIRKINTMACGGESPEAFIPAPPKAAHISAAVLPRKSSSKVISAQDVSESPKPAQFTDEKPEKQEPATHAPRKMMPWQWLASAIAAFMR